MDRGTVRKQREGGEGLALSPVYWSCYRGLVHTLCVYVCVSSLELQFSEMFVFRKLPFVSFISPECPLRVSKPRSYRKCAIGCSVPVGM